MLLFSSSRLVVVMVLHSDRQNLAQKSTKEYYVRNYKSKIYRSCDIDYLHTLLTTEDHT